VGGGEGVGLGGAERGAGPGEVAPQLDLLLPALVRLLPGRLDLLLQSRDRLLIVLRKAQGGLDLGGVGDELRIHLLALLEELASFVVALPQRPQELLVLNAEILETFIADHVLQNLLRKGKGVVRKLSLLAGSLVSSSVGGF